MCGRSSPCRDCERISQPPAPFHVTPRGWAGPNLLAMIVFEKFGQHQPLNRQAERYAREGVAFSLSTLADQVGACTAVLMPLFHRLQAHVMTAERLHGDDTTVPVLARSKTDIARLWTYVRDDRPFGGPAPPGAVFHYSRDRGGEHPQSHLAGYSGILQADAYGGYGKLYEPSRTPGPILEAACWAHARRKFFVLADVAGSARRAAQGKAPAVLSPICLEAVQRIDALFDIERDINGHLAEGTSCGPASPIGTAGDRPAPMAERAPHQAGPRQRCHACHRLSAQALGGVYPVPERWPDLHQQQRCRTRAEGHRPRAQVVAVLRLGSRRAARSGNV